MISQGLRLSAVLCLLVSIGCGSADARLREAELAERGEKLFATCASCHASRAGDLDVGPSLAGVVGRKAGSMPGYPYSQALTSSGIVWDARTLASLLHDPDGYVPGINMTLEPIADRTDVEALIAYMRQLR
ncbi:MAG TPA: c-type cytochrome [Vicinamibacterales bacterium]